MSRLVSRKRHLAWDFATEAASPNACSPVNAKAQRRNDQPLHGGPRRRGHAAQRREHAQGDEQVANHDLNAAANLGGWVDKRFLTRQRVQGDELRARLG